MLMQVNAHYDTLLTEDMSCWDHLLSNQLILVMECLATKTGEEQETKSVFFECYNRCALVLIFLVSLRVENKMDSCHNLFTKIDNQRNQLLTAPCSVGRRYSMRVDEGRVG